MNKSLYMADVCFLQFLFGKICVLCGLVQPFSAIPDCVMRTLWFKLFSF